MICNWEVHIRDSVVIHGSIGVCHMLLRLSDDEREGLVDVAKSPSQPYREADRAR